MTTTSPGRTTWSARREASSSVGAQDAGSGRDRLEHEPAGDTLAGCVASTDEAGDDRDVCEAERGAELAVEVSRSLDDVRDVERDEPSLRSAARRVERGAELGRVVAVVVDDRHAAARADDLEATVGAGERR